MAIVSVSKYRIIQSAEPYFPILIDEQSTIEIVGVLKNDPQKYGSRQKAILYVQNVRSKNVEVKLDSEIVVYFDNESILYQGSKIEFCTVYSDSNCFNIDDFKFKEYSSEYYQIRAGILESIYKRVLSTGDSGKLLLALLLGNKSEITELNRVFREAGISHLLALSGFHVSLFVIILSFALNPIFGKNISSVIIFVFLLFYIALTGFSPSLIRAALMYLNYLIYRLRNIKIDSMRILVNSFLIQVSFFPEQLFYLSFQFSYIAIFGIFLLTPMLNQFIFKIFHPTLGVAISVSLAAQWTITPLIIFYFGTVAPFAIISSVVITPLISIFIWLGLFNLVSVNMIYTPITSLLNNYLFKLIVYLTNIFSDMPQIYIYSNLNRFFISTILLLPMLLLIIYNKIKIEKKIRGCISEQKRIELKL